MSDLDISDILEPMYSDMLAHWMRVTQMSRDGMLGMWLCVLKREVKDCEVEALRQLN
jgi:hypothetical protein